MKQGLRTEIYLQKEIESPRGSKRLYCAAPVIQSLIYYIILYYIILYYIILYYIILYYIILYYIILYYIILYYIILYYIILYYIGHGMRKRALGYTLTFLSF